MTTDSTYILQKYGEFSAEEIFAECWELWRYRQFEYPFDSRHSRTVDIICSEEMKDRLSKRFVRYFVARFGETLAEFKRTEISGRKCAEFDDGHVLVRISCGIDRFAINDKNTFAAIFVPDFVWDENGRMVPMQPRIHRIWVETTVDYTI